MKETFITLGLVKRFDEKWEIVEKPTEDEMHAYEAHEDDDIEYGMSKEMIAHGSLKRCKAYNNAKEYAYYPTMVEFIDTCQQLRVAGDYQEPLDLIYRFNSCVSGAPTLDQFIPAVEVDGVWKVLSEERFNMLQTRLRKDNVYNSPTMGYQAKKNDLKECEQYQKALSKVKYPNAIIETMDHGKRTVLMLDHGGHGRTIVAELKELYGWQMEHSFTTTESLITELSKHGVCLILK